MSESIEYPRGDRELKRTLNRAGLGGDLDDLDKQLGMVGQALTALGKVLEPVLRPEESVPVQGEEAVAEAYRARGVDRDVAAVAPIRERVGELLGECDEAAAPG